MTSPTDPVRDSSRRSFLRAATVGAGAVSIGALAASPAAAQTGAAGYLPLADPFRTYDSRHDPDGKIDSGDTYVIDLSEVPPDAIAVMVNITVVDTESVTNGYLVVWGQGRARPGVSTINWFGNNQVLANMGAIPTGVTDNDLLVFCGGSGRTHFIIDLYGWFVS